MTTQRAVGRVGSLPWPYRPAMIKRIQRTWEAHLKGESTDKIAIREGVAYTTTWRDINRARELALAQATTSIEEKRAEALDKRRLMQNLALEDRDQAAPTDASGKASLLKVVGENQVAIEDLQALKPRKDGEGARAEASVTLIQIGEGPPRRVEELTDEELKELDGRLGIVEAEATVR